MEMHQIRYFLAVAETLNFTRAAEECHVAQPSLSQAIRKLEDELGGELFRRERTRTHLTDLGREMLPLLRQVFAGAAAAKEQAAIYRRAEHAPLRLGLSLTVHLDLIAPIMMELARAFPGLDLHLSRAAATEIMGALEAGDLELGIAAETSTSWDRLEHWPLFEEGFLLLAPPDWTRSSVALSALDGPGLIARPYCETLTVIPEPAAAGEGMLRQRHRVSSDEDAARFVRCGLGVSIVPESMGRLIAEAPIAIEDFEPTRIVRVYGVVGRQRSAAAGAMLKLLRAADWPSLVPSQS